MKRLFSSFLLGLASLLASCGSNSDSGEDPPPAEVAATVNGETIPLADVTRGAANFKTANMPSNPNAQGSTPEEKLYYTVVDRLIEDRLILQDATTHGISVSEDEVQATVSQLQVTMGGADAVTQRLAQTGATQEDFKRDVRINLLTQKYMDQVVNPTIEIPDEEIEAYFDNNPEQFSAKPEVRASHILFRMSPGADELVTAGARQKAEAALARAKQGEDFAALAREVSEDETTGPGGGDLGWFGKGRMVPAFDSASFSMEPGEISDLVLTQFGYHIIKVEETRTTTGKTLEEVHEHIRRFLAQGRLQEGFQEAIQQLRSAADIEITPPAAGILTQLAS